MLLHHILSLKEATREFDYKLDMVIEHVSNSWCINSRSTKSTKKEKWKRDNCDHVNENISLQMNNKILTFQ